ncbi:hypothetical protein ACQUZI_10185, partial [Streptococcus pyogenes]|uniref:hypothetical protein n=1 Tax=Streptococcus pyogenes TaxID=1314 RepID=UPI003D9FC28F
MKQILFVELKEDAKFFICHVLEVVVLAVASIMSSQTKHEMRLGSVLELLALSVTVGADLTQLQPYKL